jgi:hypothetical protein
VRCAVQAVPSLLETLQFPMGASISQSSPGQFDLHVPQLTFYDVWLQPVTRTYIEVDDAGLLQFTCDSASLTGSRHVQQVRYGDGKLRIVILRFGTARQKRFLE